MTYTVEKKTALFGHYRFKRSPRAKQLIEAAKSYPSNWQLIPVEEKLPKLHGWQNSRYSRDEICNFINDGYQLTSKKTGKDYIAYPSGVSILSGDASNGILLVDFDGPSAAKVWEAMGGESTIASQTRTHSSGKKGRKQVWFKVPDTHRDKLKNFTRHVITNWGIDTKTDSGEMLEFRYNLCQSVLPPSLHPTTGSYKWVNEGAIALCPEWLLGLLVNWADGQKAESEAKAIAKAESEKIKTERLEAWRAKQQGVEKGQSFDDVSLADFLEFEVLPRLSAEQIFNHPGHNWHYIANRMEGAPVWRESSSGQSLHVNLSDNTWYDFGLQCGGGPVQYRWAINFGGVPGSTPKGADFVEVTRELARDAGLELPELKRSVRGTIVKQSRRMIVEQYAIATLDFIEKLGRDLSLITKECRRYLRQFGELPERVGLNREGRQAWWNHGKQSALAPLEISPKVTQEKLERYFENERLRVFGYVEGMDLSDRQWVDNQEILISPNQITSLVNELNRRRPEGGTEVYLLSAPAGIGKTHQIGLIQYNFDNKTWYLDTQYRNPTTESVEVNSEELPVKHGGIVIDPYRKTETDTHYRRRALPGEPLEHWDIEGNCKHSKSFDNSRDMGYPVRGGVGSPICESCDNFKNDKGKLACPILLDRLTTAKKEKFLRSHPTAAMIKEGDRLIVEEADRSIDPFNRVSINAPDLVALLADLKAKGGEAIAQKLEALVLDIYTAVVAKDAPYHGFSAFEIIEKIDVKTLKRQLAEVFGVSELIALEVTASLLEKWLMPDLFTICQKNREPEKRAMVIKNQIRFNWLSPLLRILSSDSGSFRVDRYGLHLSQYSWRWHQQTKKAGATIAMSATLDRNDLAQRLRIPAKKIVLVRIKENELPQYQNLTIKVIKGADFGKQRRNESEYTAGQRAIAFTNWFKNNYSNPGMIDHKANLKHYQNIEGLIIGYYGNDSRGSNRFKDCDALALLGEFWPNIGSKLTDYEALTGEIITLKDPRFCCWLRLQMTAEMLGQAVGRLRAHRRPEQPLTCYLIGDSFGIKDIKKYYPGAKIETVKMVDICPAAAPKKEQKIAELTELIGQKLKVGEKVGRNEIAAELNYSPSQVTKLTKEITDRLGFNARWEEFMVVVTNVLKAINTKVTTHSPPTWKELEVAALFFPQLLASYEADEVNAEEVMAQMLTLNHLSQGIDLAKIVENLAIDNFEVLQVLFAHFLSYIDLSKSERDELKAYGLA